MPEEPKKPCVAVVEDNTSLMMLLRSILRVQGCDVHAYENGADALMAITSGQVPDMIISDVQMPKLDGISLCKAIRMDYDKSRLPILMISVLGAEDDVLAALEAGANDYLSKPFSVCESHDHPSFFFPFFLGGTNDLPRARGRPPAELNGEG